MGRAEAEVENYLKQKVESLDGFSYKLERSGRLGAPDRLCVFTHGLSAFVECKSRVGRLSGKQKREINRLVERHHLVYVTNTKKLVDLFIEEIRFKLMNAMVNYETGRFA